jgi:sulfofructose kinase
VSPASGTLWDVIGVGACAVDAVYRLPRSLATSPPDVKLRVATPFYSPGGQVATMLAAATRLGARTAYVGTTGTDDRGDQMRRALREHGIDSRFVITRDGPQAQAAILIDDRTGERVVLWSRDERLRLAPSDVPAQAILGARWLHVDDVDIDASIAAAQAAAAAGVPSSSDIERAGRRTEELISVVTFPIFALPAVAELSGEADPERGLRKLRRLHAGVLTVTLGAEGAMALEGDAIVRAPAVPIHAVDTTGAGDVFRAGFAVASLDGQSVADVLRFANAAAAASCLRVGAMSGTPNREEVARLLTAE